MSLSDPFTHITASCDQCGHSVDIPVQENVTDIEAALKEEDWKEDGGFHFCCAECHAEFMQEDEDGDYDEEYYDEDICNQCGEDFLYCDCEL